MGTKISAIVKASFVLAFGLCVSNALAIDACKEEGGHTGEGITERGQSDKSIKDAIPNSIYHYEIWYQQGNNSMTYYSDGSFSAEWNNSGDFLARVGLKYNSDKTFEELSPISADFKFTKGNGSASYSYIGIYGWTENPLSEYYITDDWFTFNRPVPGNKVGEVQVDGETYDIFTNTRYNAPSILDHNETFTQYFSVRRTARQCGHIDVTAHMKAWEKYGFKGMLYEAKLLVEAGGNATGKIDFSIAQMNDVNTIAALSGSSEPESSSSAPASSSSEAPASSSEAEAASSSSEAAPASSSSTSAAGSSSGMAIHNVAKFSATSGEFQVFNMIGKYMGKVEVSEGSSISDAVYAKFGKAGVYMVKQGSAVMPLSVK